jgi:hypothetical protein
MSAVCRLSGVLFSVRAIGPKVCGFKLARGNGFVRAIEVHSTPSFGGEVKPKAPCRKISRHVNKFYEQ